MKKPLLIVVLLLVALGILFFLNKESVEKNVASVYKSEEFGIEFSYPKNYFVGFEESFSGERSQHFVVLAEDSQENRDVFSGKSPDREGPPTITVAIYQNNLDNYTAKSFIEGTNFSNFKLSDDKLAEVSVGGENGLRYHSTGLYENENMVIARSDFVYMFTVFYLTPTDQIVSDFEKMLETIKF